jgi:hypothetical protein
MDEDIVVPLGFFIMVTACVTVAVIGSIVRKVLANRAMPAQLTPELSARLDRIESSVEAVAVEVERMAEGQRFTAKLLSERGPERTAVPAYTDSTHG